MFERLWITKYLLHYPCQQNMLLDGSLFFTFSASSRIDIARTSHRYSELHLGLSSQVKRTLAALKQILLSSRYLLLNIENAAMGFSVLASISCIANNKLFPLFSSKLCERTCF